MRVFNVKGTDDRTGAWIGRAVRCNPSFIFLLQDTFRTGLLKFPAEHETQPYFIYSILKLQIYYYFVSNGGFSCVFYNRQ